MPLGSTAREHRFLPWFPFWLVLRYVFQSFEPNAAAERTKHTALLQ